MTDTFTDMEDRDVLAGELALRLLSPLDEAQALARVETDPAFAAEVEAWNERLAAFVHEIAPVEPSGAVWLRLDAALAPFAPSGRPGDMWANDNDRVAPFWKTWAIGATALLAASLGAVAFMIAQPEPVTTPVAPPVQAPAGGVTRVATLSLDSGAPVLTLAYDTATGNLFIAPTAELAGEDGVPHLWLVLADDAGVQLVGAIDDDESSRLNLTQVMSATPGQPGQAVTMAISIEAPGTTPAQNQPNGPVVAAGELQVL